MGRAGLGSLDRVIGPYHLLDATAPIALTFVIAFGLVYHH